MYSTSAFVRVALIGSIFLFFSLIIQAQEATLDELDSLVSVYHKMAEFDKSIEYAELAMKKSALSFGTEDTVYSKRVSQLASLFQLKGDYSKAEKLHLKALQINERVLGPEHELILLNKEALGALYYRIGNYEDSEQYIKEARELIFKVYGENDIKVVENSNLLGLLYSAMERLTEAEILYKQSINVFLKLKGEDHPEVASLYNNLASLDRRLGKLKEAEELYTKAKKIMKKRWGAEHPNYGRILNNMAQVYREMREYDKAEKMYWEALRIRRSTLGEHHYRVATVYGNLAGLFLMKKDYDKALELAKKSLEINRIALGEKHTRVARMLEMIAQILNRLNDTQGVVSAVYKAFNVNAFDAIDSSMSMMEIATEHHFQNYQITAELFFLLARTYRKQYKQTEDIQYLKKSLEVQQAASVYIKKVEVEMMGKKNKLRLLSTGAALANASIFTANKLYEKTGDKKYLDIIFAFAENNKSAVLSSTLHSEDALVFGGVPSSLIEEEHAISKELTEARKQLIEAQNSQDSLMLSKVRTTLIDVKLRKDGFRKKLEKKYPKYNQLKYRIADVSVNSIQEKLLNEKTALVEYFVKDTFVYAIVITNKSIHCKPISFARKELSRKIKELRKGLSNYSFILKNQEKASSSYKGAAYFFYKKLIEPIQPDLVGVEHLIIVPDGELGHIPFEALLTKESGQEKETNFTNLPYLIQDYNISYSYSASLLLEGQSKKEKSNNGQIIAFAASYPSIKKEDLAFRTAAHQEMRSGLVSLKGVETEVKALEEQFASFGAFLYRDEASERTFKEKGGNYAIIHLAMHGILNEKYPLLSALAFTENKDSLEDNFLGAHEISSMHLNSELVVLSACETGYGKFQQGEGVLSLARSFMYAGVPSLVVSLWQVNDGSTAKIMKAFYKNLLDGKPKDIALREAKLDYIKKSKGIVAHPAFWSPFIQLGDSQPIELAEKGIPVLWWIVGLVLLFLVAVIGRMKYRKLNAFSIDS